MILLPSKGRPLSIKRFVSFYYMTGAVEPVCLILEKEDAVHYASIGLPSNWIVREYEGGKGAASHFNKVYAEFPDCKYYGIIGDDVIPRTLQWDAELKESCLSSHFAWPDDGERHEAFAPFGFMSGALVRAVGKLNYLDLDHFGFDNFWFHMGRALGGKYRGDILLEHMHPRLGKAEIDGTYRPEVMQVTPASNPDSDKWRAFKKSAAWVELKQKVKQELCTEYS